VPIVSAPWQYRMNGTNAFMRAVVCETLSDDFSGTALRDIETPAPQNGDVLVRVQAASINFPDLLICQGQYQKKPPLPFVPGIDLAGEVVGLGPKAGQWTIGDRVAGVTANGSFADFACVGADQLRPIPASLSVVEAAAYPAIFLTAYVSLVRRARLQARETLLVHGASGGVGLAAVTMGKVLGARVIATSASDEKLAILRQCGADHVLNVRGGFRQAVKDLTDGQGADVILDPVGGDVFDESVRCIAFDGRLLVLGFTSGRIANVPTNLPLIKGFSVVGVRAGEYGRRFPERGQENLDAIWVMAHAGQTQPRIHATLPLENYREGFDMLARRTVVGKVVLTME